MYLNTNIDKSLYKDGRWFTEEEAWEQISEFIEIPTPSYFVIKVKNKNFFFSEKYLSTTPILFSSKEEADKIVSELTEYKIKLGYKLIEDSAQLINPSELEVTKVELNFC